MIKEKKMEDVQEIVIDGTEVDSDAIVHQGKTVEEIKQIKKPTSNANKKGKVKGYEIDNVVVIYKDEIGKLSKEKLKITMPIVDKAWMSCLARKVVSLEFDEQNILPQTILSVSLPSKEPKEIDLPADFLTKPITQLNKREIVYAAIYHKLRTVYSALGYDEDEMRASLWNHLLNRDVKYGEDRIDKPLTDKCFVSENK